MPDFPAFPDIEGAVIALLSDLGTADVDTPADLVGNLPFIRVRCLGGNDDLISDSSRLDVDVFALLRTDARSVAESVRQRLLSFPHSLSGCVIDKVTTTISPQEIPWGNPSIRLVAASYTAVTRRHF